MSKNVMEREGLSRQSSIMHMGMKKVNNWKQKITQVSSRKRDWKK